MSLLEFSRIIRLKRDNFPENSAYTGNETANEDELLLLAERFDLQRIQNLDLEYKIKKNDRFTEAYDVEGSLRSKVFIGSDSIDIDEKFNLLAIPKNLEEDLEEEDIDLEVLDSNDSFDIGEVAAQYLSLFIYI